MSKAKLFLVVVATAGALLLAALAGVALIVYGGLYDVSATRQHWQLTHSVLEVAMGQSVRLRARAIAEPSLSDGRMALRGAACFQDKCVQCHGAPGVAQGDIGKSMQPLPGPLVDARQHWRPRELYWLVRHGLKMTGMPAWQHRLEDEEIWDVVAFMQHLPELNAAQYVQWQQKPWPAAPPCLRVAVQALRQRLRLSRTCAVGARHCTSTLARPATPFPVSRGRRCLWALRSMELGGVKSLRACCPIPLRTWPAGSCIPRRSSRAPRCPNWA